MDVASFFFFHRTSVNARNFLFERVSTNVCSFEQRDIEDFLRKKKITRSVVSKDAASNFLEGLS